MKNCSLKKYTAHAKAGNNLNKLCDYISEYVVSAFIDEDSNSRVNCKCIVVRGDITVICSAVSGSSLELSEIVNNAMESWYTEHRYDGRYTVSELYIKDIADGNNENGSIDIYNNENEDGNVRVTGFACNETPEMMPAAIVCANRIAKYIDKNFDIVQIEPEYNEMLSQDIDVAVSAVYDNNKLLYIDSVKISVNNPLYIDDILAERLIDVIKGGFIPKEYTNNETSVEVINNSERRFYNECAVTGGSFVDGTYCGFASTGDYSSYGKDPQSLHKCGMYMARHIAKSIVASYLASKCEVTLQYNSVDELPEVYINTMNTGCVPQELIEAAVKDNFPLKRDEIVEYLGLLDVLEYEDLALYNQFYNGDARFKWENTHNINCIVRKDVYKMADMD